MTRTIRFATRDDAEEAYLECHELHEARVAELNEVRVTVEQLRTALKSVEWAQATKDGVDTLYSCPGCGNLKDGARHHPDCSIGVALASKVTETPVVPNPFRRGGGGVSEPAGNASIPESDLGQLLVVATLYVNSFQNDETMSLAERMRLQVVEHIVEKYGKRY